MPQSLPRRSRPPHPYRADPSHRLALIGIRVERLTRDRRLDGRRGLCTHQYTVLDVDTTQLCTFVVLTPEDQEVKVDLDPLVRKDDGASLLAIGDWRVLPGQPSIYRRPGDFVCICLQTSSRAPCHSCFGAVCADHYLVSDFTVSHSVPGAAASGIPFGPVPEDLLESTPCDFSGTTETPEVSGPAGISDIDAPADSGALGCEAGPPPPSLSLRSPLVTPPSCA